MKESTKTPVKENTISECNDIQVCNFCGQRKHLPAIEHETQKVPALDRLLHASMSKVFGLSPASLAAAYFDWLSHLSMSPGKQAELVKSAGEKSLLFANYLSSQIKSCDGNAECCVHPLPQDKRFKDEGWNGWPYNVYQQAFLLTEQWWLETTGSVRGVTQHHADVMPFMTRQLLDMFSPLNFPMTNPRVLKTTMKEGGANFVEGAKIFFDDVLRHITQAPPAGAENYQVSENIAVTEGKVIYRNRLIELIQYAPLTQEVNAEPVLIVPAWIMKYYILDLSPKNSLVKYLVEQGHTVFMISWKNPDAEDREIGFDDYLQYGIMDALEAVTTIVPEQKVHTVGYCLGGTLLSIVASTMARDGDERLKSVTLFAAQVDFEEAGELLLFIDESQLTFLEDTMWEQGFLDSIQMAGTFYMLRSRDLIWSRIVEQYLLGNANQVNDLMAWNADATRMPYRMHSEYLRSLFLNNDLSEGRFMVGSKPISLTDIRVPIFTVSTLHDHVAPWHSVYKIRHYTDTDVSFLLTSGGHNAGIVSEPGHPHRSYQLAQSKSTDKYIGPEEWIDQTASQDGSWWPAWSAWLEAQSERKTKPPQMGAPEQGYTVLDDAPGEYVLMK